MTSTAVWQACRLRNAVDIYALTVISNTAPFSQVSDRSAVLLAVILCLKLHPHLADLVFEILIDADILLRIRTDRRILDGDCRGFIQS